MNDLGKASAYIALFSEIGFVLLFTVLAGTLAGYWLDQRLGTIPIFVLVGFAVGGAQRRNRLLAVDGQVPQEAGRRGSTIDAAASRPPPSGASVTTDPGSAPETIDDSEEEHGAGPARRAEEARSRHPVQVPDPWPSSPSTSSRSCSSRRSPRAATRARPATSRPASSRAQSSSRRRRSCFDLSPATAPSPLPMIYFHPSISSTILTMWIVMAFILLLAFVATRRMKLVPGRLQNVVEWAYEFGRDFAVGHRRRGGAALLPDLRRLLHLHPVLATGAAWCRRSARSSSSGRRRATSTSRSAWPSTSFVLFQGEGFRRLGVRGYLGKFFPIGEFRHGHRGRASWPCTSGIIELFLEFVKPVTLAMRLFGNIYGGEVALAVITALTLAVVPVALVRPGGAAEPHPGPHLLGPDPHVHPDRHRGSRAEEHHPAAAGASAADHRRQAAPINPQPVAA